MKKLPNFSMLASVLTNHFGSRVKTADKLGISADSLRSIELRESLNPRYTTGVALIMQAEKVFGSEKTKQYMETE